MNYKKLFLVFLVISFSFNSLINSRSSVPVGKIKKNNAYVKTESNMAVNIIRPNAFRVTHNKYSCKVNLKQAVENDLGDEWIVADWEDLKKIDDRAYNKVKMRKGDEYLLLRNGQKYHSGTRHYFMAKHQGDIPGGFAVHDQIGGNYFSLGSWHNITMKILCVKKEAVNRD